jgi:hypothetical protein
MNMRNENTEVSEKAIDHTTESKIPYSCLPFIPAFIFAWYFAKKAIFIIERLAGFEDKLAVKNASGRAVRSSSNPAGLLGVLPFLTFIYLIYLFYDVSAQALISIVNSEVWWTVPFSIAGMIAALDDKVMDKYSNENDDTVVFIILFVLTFLLSIYIAHLAIEPMGYKHPYLWQALYTFWIYVCFVGPATLGTISCFIHTKETAKKSIIMAFLGAIPISLVLTAGGVFYVLYEYEGTAINKSNTVEITAKGDKKEIDIYKNDNLDKSKPYSTVRLYSNPVGKTTIEGVPEYKFGMSLNTGEYRYTIEKEGYKTLKGSFTLNNRGYVKDFELEPLD